MTKTKSTLLVLVITCTFIIAGSGFAAGTDERSEISANSTVSPIAELETAPLNPLFLEYQQTGPGELLAAPDEYGHAPGPGYIPSPVDLSGISKPGEMFLLRASEPGLPVTYDLRKEGKVTSVKDQGDVGSCWAFASIASLESYLLGTEGEYRDFSENNMKNLVSAYYPGGFDLLPSNGGNAFMSMAYLSRWTGPVEEADDLYNDASAYSPQGLPAQKHAQEILFLPIRTGAQDNENIKRAIMEYGAVYSAFCWNSNNYTPSNYTYYYSGSYSSNHAITLVGWNDSFDRNSFVPTPEGDGAFIVKNSWGVDWGEEGYFYISYYDSKLAYDENAVFTAEEPDNYDYAYQYDPLGWVVSKGDRGALTAWGGNVFFSERNETLRAIGLYTTDLDTAYEIYIYRDPLSGPVNSDGVFAVRENGTYHFPGYHTHVLDSPVTLCPGENFSVVIKFSNPSEDYPLAAEQPLRGYSSNAQANPGESYTSPDGSTWQDISADSEANLCIKAFSTTDELPDADFSADVRTGVPPLTVRFTDLSEKAFSWEWDTDGDGTVDNTTQNPEHSYGLYGTYNVTLSASNRNGESSETKTAYISVEPLSISGSLPEGDVESFEDETAEFSISTNYPCTISWYLDGAEIKSGAGISASSYTSSSAAPGIHNVTATAKEGYENRRESWNWTVRDWNPWDNPDSEEGTNVTTEELQESIHCYLNGLEFTENGAEPTDERLGQLIRIWLEE